MPPLGTSPHSPSAPLSALVVKLQVVATVVWIVPRSPEFLVGNMVDTDVLVPYLQLLVPLRADHAFLLGFLGLTGASRALWLFELVVVLRLERCAYLHGAELLLSLLGGSAPFKGFQGESPTCSSRIGNIDAYGCRFLLGGVALWTLAICAFIRLAQCSYKMRHRLAT
uniref:Uncharacterized protein n=1 Tax=Oryza glumipatula TaxID=40148 RepID=A0A0E0AV39_9ORYZ